MAEKDGREIIRRPDAGPGDAAKPEAFGRGEHPADKEKKPGQGDEKKPDLNDEKKKPEEPKKPFWKRPVLLSVMIAVAVSAIIAGVLYLNHAENFEGTDDAFIDGRIIHVAPRVAGKVKQLLVDDNAIVTADQPLLLIDSKPYEVKVDQAKGALAQATAQFAQAQANVDVAEANAAQADADVKVTIANQLNARRDFDRFSKLSKEARSQQQLDAATANKDSSDAQVTASEKKAASMHASVDASRKMVDAAKAAEEAANAQLEQANLDLSYTTVVAGYAGRVTRRTVEQGNYVSIGQELLDVVGTSVPKDIWVTANFKESQLKKMEKGQHVTISIDAYPDEKLQGRVDSIQNGTGAVFSLLPPENATGNYVKVVQRVPVKIIIESQPRHMLSPGLSVQPEVDVRDHQQEGDSNNANASNSPTSQR